MHLLTTGRKAIRMLKQLPNRIRYRKPSNTFCRLGTEYGGWWIECKDLSAHSNILSAGVGEDASFEYALIQLLGCRVLAIDPTPKAVAYVANSSIDSRFRFEAVALADTDGTIRLVPPRNPDHASFSLAYSTPSIRPIDFPAKSLATIMAENSWTHFDLIKMDIEGSEYSVIDSIIDNNIPVSQLCLEFHDRLAVLVGRSTEDAIQKLRAYGLRLVYRENHNYTFVSNHLSLTAHATLFSDFTQLEDHS